MSDSYLITPSVASVFVGQTVISTDSFDISMLWSTDVIVGRATTRSASSRECLGDQQR